MPEEFHAEILKRSSAWPYEMLATSTHDSKRSEDVRARINVLSEMPLEWHRRVRTWREMNRSKKQLSDDAESPTANDEYLFYQTLIGAWPMGVENENPPESFRKRICDYMIKAVREAKEKTSWANPNTEYESSLTSFVNAVIDSREFRDNFLAFQKVVSQAGMLNSLAQTVIKLAAPGVPDIYQGNELWEFNLVDPDNRRAVDYERRREMLREFRELQNQHCSKCLVQPLLETIQDGRIKLYVTWKLLTARREKPDLFVGGDYLPLKTSGPLAKHVLAFARRRQSEMIVVAVPRLCARLLKATPNLPLGPEIWQDTEIEMPFGNREFGNLFTNQPVIGRQETLAAAEAFREFPVACLVSYS
jgi:(1->4)-alpha-D-glucan 1-alpha-D-glucosylmutase